MSQTFPEVEKLNILSEKSLADRLRVPRERLVEISLSSASHYDPFPTRKAPRPFQKKTLGSPRNIDNPQDDTRWVQKRIYQRLLKPICFPPHIMGAVRKLASKNWYELERGGRVMPSTLGQRVAKSSRLPPTDNRGVMDTSSTSAGRQWWEPLTKEIGDSVSQMTPLERMNLRYPNMKLHRLPESQRELFGEPDLDVCLRYYRNTMAAIKSDGNEPVSVLSEFLRKHPIEFQCSGWVWYAFGYIVLGYPDLRNCEARARKLFSLYWRNINSRKHGKKAQKFIQMFRASKKLDSPHMEHWRSLVRWMNRAADRGLPSTSWFAEYAGSRSKKCTCLNKRSFQALEKARIRLVSRFEGYPPPSAVVLEAVAAGHRVSSRALAEFRADARKRTRNSQ
jgi:hypothetical protein